jgi:hypothetical protein
MMPGYDSKQTVTVNWVITACRKDWHSTAIGAVLSSDLGAKGASRSCPAGLTADAGLRGCGGNAVMNRMEDLNVKVCKEAITCKIAVVC